MRNKLLYTGVLFFLIGLFLALNSFSSITGLVVLSEISSKTSSFLGIIFIVAGLIFTVSSRATKSNLEILVKDRSNGKDKDHDRAYVLFDKANELGGGVVTLGEFKKQVRALQEDGEELVEIVKEVYGPQLKKLAYSNESYATVAREFLRVLGNDLQEENSGKYHLPKTEKDRIKNAFKSYNGSLTSDQVAIFKDYDMYKITEKTHYKFEHTSGRTFTMSKSPSDFRAGRKISKDLIKFIEENTSSKSV